MTSRRWSAGHARLVLLAAVGLFFLPFLGQAIHIDDRIYLEIADQILRNPLYPYDYSPIFEGLVTDDAASHSHLPLTAYYLALVRLIGGAEEWVLHLAFLVFPLIAVVSFYDLAGHYVRHRLLAGLLLVVSPAFLVLGHTLMPDVPLLAFWLLALSRLLRLRNQEAGRVDLILFGIGLLGAAFISLLAGGLLLLAGAFLIMSRNDLSPIVRKSVWLILLLAPALWLAWYLRAYLHYDRFVLIQTLLHVGKREAFDWSLLGVKLVSFVVNTGAVFLCPLALWAVFSGSWRTRLGLLTLIASFFPFALWIEGWSWSHVTVFAVFFASGFLVMWEFVLLIADRGPRVRLLLLWFFGILAACLLLFYAGSVRYVLLALPPVLIAWVRRVELSRWSDPLKLAVLVGGVLLTAATSLPIAVADYELAGLYRRTARELFAEYGGPNHRVWFTGEWGFRYYLEREGATLMTRHETGGRPGDIIVKPYVASPWVTVYDGNEWTSLLEQRVMDQERVIRLLDFSTHAGFYSTGWGILPVSFGQGERWEWVNVFRIDRVYDGPEPERERHF